MDLAELKERFVSRQFAIVLVVLIIMWLGIMLFFYLKADEVTKDPCSICAKRMGEDVVCTTGTTYITERTYYPNGSIYTQLPNQGGLFG